MNIEIEHPFLRRCHDINGLLKNTKTLSAFCRKLEAQSILFPDRYETEKYKGDGLELFSEVLIKLSPIDNRIAIGSYKPELNEDTGVDGYGIGIDGKSATVQVKYRSNTQSMLTANYDHLSNFVMTSIIRYKVDSETKTNLLIITTAAGLHYFTENEMFLKQVRCLGYEQLRDLVDNNIIFWDKFKEIIKWNLDNTK